MMFNDESTIWTAKYRQTNLLCVNIRINSIWLALVQLAINLQVHWDNRMISSPPWGTCCLKKHLAPARLSWCSWLLGRTYCVHRCPRTAVIHFHLPVATLSEIRIYTILACCRLWKSITTTMYVSVRLYVCLFHLRSLVSIKLSFVTIVGSKSYR